MADDKPTKSLLDLVPSGPTYSPKPFDFFGQQVKWKLLDGQQVDACRTAGSKVAFNTLVEQFGLSPKDAYSLLLAGSSFDTQKEWYEYYTLAAAMVDMDGQPISMAPPDDVAYQLSKRVPPIMRARLIDDYVQFADEHDPSTITDEDIEEIIAQVGKGAGESIWQQYGSNSLRSLCASTVPRLIKAEMAVAELQAAEDLESRVAALEREISPTAK
jgi:hypothetical protein